MDTECNGMLPFLGILDKENKTSECERHVSATPVPSSVYRWNYNEEQYIVEN